MCVGALEFIKLCATLKQEVLDDMRRVHDMPEEAVQWVDKVRAPRATLV